MFQRISTRRLLKPLSSTRINHFPSNSTSFTNLPTFTQSKKNLITKPIPSLTPKKLLPVFTTLYSTQQMQFFKHVWSHGSAASTETKWDESQGTITQFKMNDIDGTPFDFASLDGKVVVLTSTACDCGFTKKGYQHLVEWKNDLKEEPFEVLAFPSNSFQQETKTPAEIKAYVTENFGLNFPLMEKSDINGDKTNPVYTWLKKSFPGDITWNFSSYFLVNHQGVPIQRFEKESWDDIKVAIDKAVEEAKAAQKKE